MESWAGTARVAAMADVVRVRARPAPGEPAPETDRGGVVVLHADGGYPCHLDIHPEPLGGGGCTTAGATSFVAVPGASVSLTFDTFGERNQVDVTGLRPDGSPFLVGSVRWSSRETPRLTLRAQGTPEAPVLR